MTHTKPGAAKAERNWASIGTAASMSTPAESPATSAIASSRKDLASGSAIAANYPSCPRIKAAEGGRVRFEIGDMAVATAPQDLTDEHPAITEMVRQFADNEIIPVAEEYDHEDKFPEPIVEQMKELGLFGVTIPEEYGGMGLDLTTYAMIVEELARGWISISGVINTHFIGSYLLMKFG